MEWTALLAMLSLRCICPFSDAADCDVEGTFSKQMTVGGACGPVSFVNGAYVLEGATADGRDYYANGVGQYLYYDPDCSGGAKTWPYPASARWMIADTKPSTTATTDLAGDGATCVNNAYLATTARTLPPNAAWRMFCAEITLVSSGLTFSDMAEYGGACLNNAYAKTPAARMQPPVAVWEEFCAENTLGSTFLWFSAPTCICKLGYSGDNCATSTPATITTTTRPTTTTTATTTMPRPNRNTTTLSTAPPATRHSGSTSTPATNLKPHAHHHSISELEWTIVGGAGVSVGLLLGLGLVWYKRSRGKKRRAIAKRRSSSELELVPLAAETDYQTDDALVEA